MSCCGSCANGGASQIFSLTVPGIDQTDGAPADISELAPNKSIQISGNYDGQYIILGSHDGDPKHYVPLLTFNSGSGPQSFQQTMPYTVRFLKVRRRAFVSNVSSVIVAASFKCDCATTGGNGGGGAAQIVPLDVPGLDGIDGAITDTSNLVPRKSIQISGEYDGQIIILGSHNDVNFVPLLVFNSGSGPQAFRQTMCLTVNSLRVRRRATASGTILVNMAAGFQCACA